MIGFWYHMLKVSVSLRVESIYFLTSPDSCGLCQFNSSSCQNDARVSTCDYLDDCHHGDIYLGKHHYIPRHTCCTEQSKIPGKVHILLNDIISKTLNGKWYSALYCLITKNEMIWCSLAFDICIMKKDFIRYDITWNFFCFE